MAEKISRSNATLALSSFPQNNVVRLSVVADEMTDDTENLKKSSEEIVDARPPPQIKEENFFKKFQSHIHVLAHYQERTGFFQKTIERAIKDDIIGLRLFSQEDKKAYDRVLEQVNSVVKTVSSSTENAIRQYESGLEQILGKKEEKTEKERFESELNEKLSDLESRYTGFFNSIEEKSKSLQDELKKYNEIFEEVKAATKFTELETISKKFEDWSESLRKQLSEFSQQKTEDKTEIETLIEGARQSVRNYKKSFKDQENINEFEKMIREAIEKKDEAVEMLEELKETYPSTLKDTRNNFNEILNTKINELKPKKQVEEKEPEETTVSSQLAKWTKRVTNDSDLKPWMDGSIDYSKKIYNEIIPGMVKENGEGEFDKVNVYGLKKSERILERKGQLTTWFPEQDQIFRGRFSIVGRLGGDSLTYTKDDEKMPDSIGDNPFQKEVSPLFDREWTGKRTKVKYEMPDIDWTILRIVQYAALNPKTKGKERYNTPAPKKKLKNPLGWSDGQVIHCITMRPYFGYSPVIVQLNITLRFNNQDQPTRFDGVYFINYEKEVGTSPNSKEISKDGEKWDSKKEYWNVDYEWNNDKPGHSLNLVFFELASAGINEGKDKGKEVFEHIVNHFEKFVASEETTALARWHHVPVMLALEKYITQKNEGEQLAFVNLLRKMRLPGQEYKSIRGSKRNEGGELTKIEMDGFALMVSAENLNSDSPDPLYKQIAKKINDEENFDPDDVIKEIRSFELNDGATEYGPPYIWLPFRKELDSDDIGKRVSLFNKTISEEIYEEFKDKINVDVVGESFEKKDEDGDRVTQMRGTFVRNLGKSQSIADIIEESMILEGASDDVIEESKKSYPPSSEAVTPKKVPISATSCME